MSNLTKTTWPLGWTPSADITNGNPDGLLRMDNLQLEEDGCVTLVRGIQKIGSTPLAAPIEIIYSRNNDSTELTYAGTTGFGVYKSTNLGTFNSLISGNDHVAFGDAYGQTFILAGSTKVRDKNGTLIALGIDKPAAKPDVSVQNQPHVDISNGTWSTIEGHDGTVLGTSYQLFTDSTTLQLVMEMDLGGNVDTTAMGNSGPYDLTSDTFNMLIQCHDKALFANVRVQLIIDNDNYFFKEWDIANDSSVNVGINSQSHLSCKRGEFKRVGGRAAGRNRGWDTITKVRVTGTAISDTYLLAGEQQFVGGVKGVLNGFYKYMTVAVANDGSYLGKSPKSDDSDIVYFQNGYATITTAISPNPAATEYWIFRRSVVVNPEVNLIQSHLDQWFRVGVSDGSPFDDIIDDNEAILTNITFNEFLQSIATLPDSIISVEGMYNERMIYMTFREVIISDRLNPDAYDPNQVLRISGDTSEKNLWIRKVTNSTLILATTKDLYEISGTLLDLPDGSLDVYIRPIGEAFPPLGLRVASEGGILFYVAKDGIRGTSGSNSNLISPQLTLLFQSETRASVPPVAIVPGSVGDYALTTGRNKLYVAVPCEDGSRRLFIYSLITHTWRLQFTDPIALGCTTTGRILAGYGGGSGNYVRELEKDTGVDGAGGLPFTLLTVFDANGQPRNRKDTFTLKLVMDTGGVAVNVALASDNGSFITLLVADQQVGQTYYYRINYLGLGFRYAIRITDAAGAQVIFKLYEYTIEYDARPEQVDYLRIPNTNLSTAARKRFITFAFVIDTLGNGVTFYPYVDGVLGSPSSFSTNNKLTYIHYFQSETIGTDIGGVLIGGVFEFYALNLEESISEKLPAPAEYLVIPASDYGTPNRKRHTSYKFQINTRGHNVTFTPRIDGTNYSPTIVNTTEKRTVEHFFDPTVDIVGIDIGGTLQCTSFIFPFEFYGTIVPQEIEVLPPRLDSYYLPVNNFGTAARKRIRTLPLVIDTRGQDCVFTPIVDDAVLATSTFNTSRKQTVYHFFSTDVFGIDFQGILRGVGFEFYGFGQMENVEILPVPKKYDQFQPIRFDKIGKLFAFRIRLVAPAGLTSIPYSIVAEGQTMLPTYAGQLYNNSFAVVPGVDDVYEIELPKSVNATLIRIVLGPTLVEFHRYDVQIRVADSGMETDSKWIPLR